MKPDPLSSVLAVLATFVLVGCGPPVERAGDAGPTPDQKASPAVTVDEPTFSFDCDNTPANPCRRLVATHQGRSVTIEPSSVAWSERYQKAIVVSDNYNELQEHGAAHFVIVSFGLEGDSTTIPVEPLLTPKQAADQPLYDLEGVTLHGGRLYTMGSLALHGKNPARDRWERNQFVSMGLGESDGRLRAVDITHVSKRWPSFRDWLISKSGFPWRAEETRGRAEGEGINVEALASMSTGHFMLGFRGPLSVDGGVLALEVSLPASADEEPAFVKTHVLPRVSTEGAPKTLRGMYEVPYSPGAFYVLLGPKGYEKESIVLGRWDSKTGELTKVTPLPANLVAEGVAPIGGNRLLIVDDLKELILVATETGPPCSAAGVP